MPVNETAGSEQERFRRQAAAEETVARLERELAEEAPVAEAEAVDTTAEGGREFDLKAVRVSGNRKIPSEKLEALAAGWIGRRVDLADLKQVASKIKKYYRDRGFVAAYVYLPPQDVSTGVVEITVIEGRLGQVRVKGNRWYSSGVLREALGLRSGDVIYAGSLSSGLSYLNANPDLKTKALLAPGEEPQTTDVLLEIEDRFPVHMNAEVNNLGSRSTGETRWGLGASHNNLTGRMDKLAGRYQVGSGAWAAGGDYTYPLRPNSTDVSVSVTHSKVDLGGDFAQFDIEGEATTYGTNVRQRLWTNQFVETFGNVGFDWKTVDNSILGQEAGHDELRVLNTGFEIQQTDRYGKTYIPNTISTGFSDFLGSSDKVDARASRSGTGGQFFVYRGSVIRYNRLPGGMTHAVRGNLQLSSDRLPPSEQLRLGGAFSVRGYAEGDYLADHGAHISNEIYVPTYFFPAHWKLPGAKEPLQKQVQAVGFIDFGYGGINSTLPGERDNRTLSGAGGGFRIHLYDRVFARLQWAGRLGPQGNDSSNSVFYYGLSTEIF